MKKISLTVTVVFVLVISLAMGTVTAGAESLSDLRNQISEKKSELEKGKAQEEGLTQKLLELEQAIDVNTGKLDTLEEELKAAEEKVETQTDNLNGRLRNMYKNGSIGFLDVLLESGSFSEFLTNLDLVTIIYSSDRDVLKDLKEAHDQVEAKKKEVEKLQNELKASQEVVSAEKERIAASNEETEKMIDSLQADADRLTEELRQQGSSSSNSDYTGGQMAWPIPAGGVITSPFGYRMHPTLNVWKFHSGVDIGGNSTGTSIVAASSGTVYSAGWNGGYGKCVIIDHGGGVTTLYGHCSALYVSSGQTVSRGQSIAAVGSTGISNGPHLHFEVRVNGAYQNPLPYIT